MRRLNSARSGGCRGSSRAQRLPSVTSGSIAGSARSGGSMRNTSAPSTMTVARNLFIGREPLYLSVGGIGFMNQRKMREDSVRAIADVDLHLRSPDTLLGELSGGQRQGVAIARAMYFKSKVLILDEPTNHLSVKETAKVLGFVKGLLAQNVTGIFVSHNLHHVFVSCERVVVMARGRVVLNKKISET
jgi:simple sugar transport system ATP-binding protein